MDSTEVLSIIIDGLEALQDEPDDEVIKSDVALHLTNLAEHLAKGGDVPDAQEAFRKAGYVLD